MIRSVVTLILLIMLLPAPRCRAEDDLPRTWTNSLGVKMEATFVRAEGDKVTLLLNSGQMVTMPVDKFSPADQDYIHGLQAKAAATPAPAMTPDAPAANSPQPETSQATPTPSRGKSILLRPALIHAPDPRVQPKAEIYVPFPDLGKSRTDEPMGMHIRIPASYKPDRPVPLLVWLAGGDGTSRFNAAESLVNEEDFVLVAMNYPAAVPEPQYASVQGKIEQIWALHEKMLVKLQDMIPNIDPRLRVIAGFSNGAHVIGGCLAHQVDGLSHYFNVFVLIEGGYSDSFNYPSLPGRYFYIASGTKGGDGADFNAKLAGYARKAGMKVEAHVMDGAGHDFPDSEQARVRSWLENTVVPAQLAAP
jgi:predicted esterase